MQKPAWLSRNVVALGVVSLLTDASSEMVMPLLPLFLTTTLGGGAVALGLVEGAAEATAAVLKLVAGRIADRTGDAKALVLAGYTVSTIARPLVALAMAPWHVVAIRVADRVGKGLRSTPRDALLAASVDARDRGVAFGFHRSMDHAGAIVGPLLALAILAREPENLRLVFALALIPGLLAVLAILPVRNAELPRAQTLSLGPPSPALIRFLVPLGVFTLGRASETFLLLKAGAEHAPTAGLPALWILLHLVKATLSTPAGRLADRWGRRRTIAIGWTASAVVSIGFASASDLRVVAGLFVAYGLYAAFAEGAEKALVAELAPDAERGTAFGWYYLVSGLVALPGGLLFGGVWDTLGNGAAFGLGAALAVVALLIFGALAPGGAGVTRRLG